MKNKILLPLIALIVTTGCVQKTKISMKVPGEINVKGIHNIAIVNFSSVNANSEQGIYRASNDLLKLAKDEVANVFYDEKFYDFSNLEIESNIKKRSLNSKVKNRFDGILYGKVWWKITPEYKNIIPSKEKLETYTMQTYVSGRTKKGKPIYSTAHLTTKTQDKAFDMHYRVKNATLMMSLNLYKISKNGKLSKVTEVFEIGKGKYEITNGVFKKDITVIGEKEKLDKIKILTKKKETGFLSGLLNISAKKSEKVNADVKTANNLQTIPSKYIMGQELIDKITMKLKKMIAPTRQEFELNIEKGDKKVEKMFDYSAFNAIVSYIVEQKLSLGYDEFYDGFYNMDFVQISKELFAFIDKEKFNKDNKKAKKKAIYKPLKDDELNSMALDHLKTNASMIYNYGLATEAIGNFEAALEIYRFLFNTIDDKNQNYADGIGRSLLALDMNDKVTEEKRNKRKAKKANLLK